MAAGDIIAARINPDGRLLHLKLEGMAAGGTYLFGASTPAVMDDRTNATAKVKLNVTSAGYSTAGVLGTIARTVWGPIDQRLPYGDGTVGKWISSGAMTGTMVNGETVTQAVTGATAVVVTNCPCAPLIVNATTGSPNSSDIWTGGTSGATFTPTVAPATYSGVSVKREGTEGADLWIAIALDEYIYSDCTVTLDALSAIYTKTAVPNNAVTGYAVTNASAATHSKAILRWATVPHQRVTTATFTLKAAGYHRFARNGKPFACVIFTMTDGSTTRTVTATQMTLQEQMPITGLYTSLYEGTFTMSDFTDNAVVTCNVAAYPWVGDASSVTDSDTVSSPSKSLCDLPIFNDYDDDFGVTIAYVDQTSAINTASDLSAFVEGETLTQATTGATAFWNYYIAGSPNIARVSNVTGSPNNSNIWTGGTSGATLTPTTTPTAIGNDSNNAYDISNDATAQANPCATIGGATVRIATYNNANRSRNNCDAGIVYLMKGVHHVTGAITALTTSTYVTITRQAGLAEGDAKLQKKNNVLPVRMIMPHVKLYDLDIVPRSTDTSGAAAITFYAAFEGGRPDYTWVDYCRIKNTSLNADTTWEVFSACDYIWHTHNILQYQRKPIDQANNQSILSMDNLCTLGTGWYSHIATICNSWASHGNVIADTAQDNCIYLNNKAIKDSGTFLSRSTTCSHGIAAIGNAVETISNTSAALLIFADANTAHSANVNLVHNTVAGERTNWSYCNGATPANRINHSAKYNANQWMPHKYDSGTNQKNVLANPVTYGAGHCGNYSESLGTPSVDSFIWPGWLWGVNASAGYTDDLSKTTAGAGGGDYLPTEVSPLLNRVPSGESVWPYGINGVAYQNDGTAPAGAFGVGGSGGGGSAANLLLMGVG